MDYEKNIHAGHRARLFAMADRVGVENLDRFQALELILCLVFPRGDVNPLAHRLLDRYHDVVSAVSAPVEDLVQVRGISEKSAKKLRSLGGITKLLNIERATKKTHIEDYNDACDFVENLLRYAEVEEFHAIGISSSNHVLGNRKLAEGTVNVVNINMQALSLFVATTKAVKIFLVHNHPNGLCMPSQTDIDSHAVMEGRFNFSGCELVDNLIVGVDGIYSIKYNYKVREFKNPLPQLSKEDGMHDELFYKIDSVIKSLME